MPKVFGWQLLESIRPYFTAVATPFIYLPFIIYISHKSKLPVTWRMKRPPIHLFLLMVILAIAIRLIIQPFIIPVEYFGNLIDGKFKLLRFNVPEFNPLMATILIINVTIVPVLEEIFWRKQLFGLFLKKYTPALAMILSSALFACAHFQTGIIGVIFIWGLLCSFVYYITNSLELSIVLHSIINLSAPFIEHRYIAFNGLRLNDSITLIIISSVILYLAIQYLWQHRLADKDEGADLHTLS
jgi:membrane protease YdiL (CAAX protease family)